jgi:hypothetical protein
MAAELRKNSAIDNERRVHLYPVYKNGGLLLAPRGTDFIALGILYVADPNNAPHAKLGQGTCTNVRRPLVVANDVVEAADSGADTVTMTGHPYETGDGPFTADGNLGAAMADPDSVFIIVVDPNTIAVANTLPEAYANTRVALAGTETGSTISYQAATMRGIDGAFSYVFTPAETNVTFTQQWVLIEGPDYNRAEYGGIYYDANLPKVVTGFDDQMEADGTTYGDGARAQFRGETQDYDRDANGNYMHKKPDGTDSHGGQVTGAGRVKNIPAGGLDP